MRLLVINANWLRVINVDIDNYTRFISLTRVFFKRNVSLQFTPLNCKLLKNKELDMMKPQKIRALLIEQGEKQINIARKLNVSHAAVNMVIDGKFVSRRIRMAIAEKVCIPFEKMWGNQLKT